MVLSWRLHFHVTAGSGLKGGSWKLKGGRYSSNLPDTHGRELAAVLRAVGFFVAGRATA